jgi:hypothetical protein
VLIVLSDEENKENYMKIPLITFFILIISANAHAWCSYSGVPPGKKLEPCECGSSTPAKEIASWEKSGWPISISDEVKDSDGKVISLEMRREVPNDSIFYSGGVNTSFWFRTKKACQESRKIFSEENTSLERRIKENDKKRLSPYQ